jgi:ceramide glucosyltransferase
MVHISIWRAAVLLIALAPLAYYVVVILAALRFFGTKNSEQPAQFQPSVSILKPVRGVDFASYENFASFCRQDYPDYEILFCVNELSDSAVPVIQKLINDFPERRIRMLSGAEKFGTNQKVNNLALLAREARHELLMQSDADVRVSPQYLKQMAAPFADPAMGLTSCLYRAHAQPNLYAELEAVGAASDFLAGALVADWLEGTTFALGASVATSKTWLRKIGGYEAFANVLADDYEIGNRIHRTGGKVLLSREIVWTMYPAQNFRGFWEHQVRWARTVRTVRPSSFVALIVTHGLPWAIVAALAAPTSAIAAAYLLAYLLLRLAAAWIVGVWGVGDEVLRRKLWLVPLRDALHFAVWLAGFTSNRVMWGGLEYEIRGGKMTPVSSLSPE